METQVQIDFHGGQPIERLHPLIADHLAQLENRFGRITAARIVVAHPSAHHRNGGQFEVGIHLTLPGGRVVDVQRTPDADERFADPVFAVHDAFKRARRRLQDVARKLQGKVKRHEPAPTGRVVRLDRERGFGFISTADGREIYFHRNSVLGGKFGQLEPDSPVWFAEERGDEGPQASTVRLLEGHRMRA